MPLYAQLGSSKKCIRIALELNILNKTSSQDFGLFVSVFVFVLIFKPNSKIYTFYRALCYVFISTLFPLTDYACPKRIIKILKLKYLDVEIICQGNPMLQVNPININDLSIISLADREVSESIPAGERIISSSFMVSFI